MPKGYTTKENLENYLQEQVPGWFLDQLDTWMEAVETIIDRITGRNFVADTNASARVYDGDGTQKLLVDDCVEVTLVEVGNDTYGSSFSTIAASGADRYFAYPANYTALAVPISSIVLNARTFPGGLQNNRITAKWGYSAVAPKDIRFAATVFLAGIFNQKDNDGQEIKSEKIGNYQVTYNSDGKANSWDDFESAKQMLEKYTKLLI